MSVPLENGRTCQGMNHERTGEMTLYDSERFVERFTVGWDQRAGTMYPWSASDGPPMGSLSTLVGRRSLRDLVPPYGQLEPCGARAASTSQRRSLEPVNTASKPICRKVCAASSLT